MTNYRTNWEDNFLAAYAAKSRLSKGRAHKEKEHLYRSSYQRDRDRIIHSAAFRRLEYKTQVFVNHEGDYYRTRLTHTLEVSQIARTIASRLHLNCDLVEAVALAHDLGHTPFGHSGEDTLNELMSDSGGFNHNLQGLRIVDILEERYPEFPGLNLTWEVREGIVKHSAFYDNSSKIAEFNPEEMPSLETQVVDIADEIAYNNHDIDDGLTSGLIEGCDLKGIKLWDIAEKKITASYGRLKPALKKYQIIRLLIDMQVTDLIKETQAKIKKARIRSYPDLSRLNYKLVSFSPDMESLRIPLKDFLTRCLYRNYRVVRMANKANRFLKDLFEIYLNNPEQLPPEVSLRIAKGESTKKVICDYIAGMTDRQALDEYKKLFDPYEKV